MSFNNSVNMCCVQKTHGYHPLKALTSGALRGRSSQKTLGEKKAEAAAITNVGTEVPCTDLHRWDRPLAWYGVKVKVKVNNDNNNTYSSSNHSCRSYCSDNLAGNQIIFSTIDAVPEAAKFWIHKCKDRISCNGEGRVNSLGTSLLSLTSFTHHSDTHGTSGNGTGNSLSFCFLHLS